ncbi:reverse transcriptase [Senna tora]|uniref:Reverse transcriptase n=1 Tax=Senna tora TaxID=362788 RepID=A0A835CKR8_9FABA|nr:reverse transcriptase [Senna tora]
MHQKLTGWKASMLSQAARYTLIQSVLSAIPVYLLHFTRLTDKVANACNSLMNNFFWGSWDGKKSIHMIAWDKICNHKAEGGLGLRNVKVLNQAILGKQFWRILTNKTCLMNQQDVLTWNKSTDGKYNVRSAYNLLHSRTTPTPSRTTNWRNIWRIDMPYKITLFWWKTMHRECPFAKLVWFHSHLMIRTEDIPHLSIIDWIDYWIQDSNPDHAQIRERFIPEAIIICWSIYTQRNQIVFQNGDKDHNVVLQRVHSLMSKIQHAARLNALDPFYAIQRNPIKRRHSTRNTGDNLHTSHIFCSWRKDRRLNSQSILIFSRLQDHVYPLILLVVTNTQPILHFVMHCIWRMMLAFRDRNIHAIVNIPSAILVNQLQQKTNTPCAYSVIVDDMLSLCQLNPNVAFCFSSQVVFPTAYAKGWCIGWRFLNYL